MPRYQVRKHKRFLPPWFDPVTESFGGNKARCSRFGETECTDVCCPRHRPENYPAVAAHSKAVLR